VAQQKSNKKYSGKKILGLLPSRAKLKKLPLKGGRYGLTEGQEKMYLKRSFVWPQPG
jgi:hypothetical protein